ncbi:MAG: DEAD/DEAH box helicase [Gammaproteobacteria bacterium]|nr:DEAD/DEAH box helicase [Gammaproteobacteria bacterium]
MAKTEVSNFDDLGLNKQIVKVLSQIGYESPSPIQAETIPLLLDGRDVLGQAQTGTGKTAAFALPIINNLSLSQKSPQVLVLAPTRELAIQVAEAFQKYAHNLNGFHVLPIYGGQDYSSQLRALKRGPQVIVGTPGRVMDHMRRGTLVLSELKVMVLDEADEMLRMGFIDDVEWILEKTPKDRQIALFSATMPKQIKHIATNYLNNPAQVHIKLKTATAETIRQRFWPVSGYHKLDALTRILEAEHFDAVIIFVRTKTATIELAEKLEARGYSSAALNGDIAQNHRERTIEQLKQGKIDILVATDVAARGLDVKRISHVINYDIPYDAEAYIHRIGRTGRAGQNGEAILFVQPREKRLLSIIEKATNKKIEMMDLPSTDIINDKRIEKFKLQITDTLAIGYLDIYSQLIEEYEKEYNIPALEIAAALAKLLQGNQPFLLQDNPRKNKQKVIDEFQQRDQKSGRERRRSNASDRGDRDRNQGKRSSRNQNSKQQEMDTFRIEVGHDHKVKPGNIVGAIANEAGLDSADIGHIKIFDQYSLVDLPKGMPKSVFDDLKHAWVSGKKLDISRIGGDAVNKRSRKPANKPADKKVSKKDNKQKRQ